MPRAPHRLVNQAIRAFVANESLLHGIELEIASEANRDFCEVDNRARTVAIGFVQGKFISGANGFAEVGDLRRGFRLLG